MRNTLIPIFFLGALVACSGENHEDLTVFMAEVKARPVGQIEPIPTFMPYEPFEYSIAQMRSPFEKPVTIENLVQLFPASEVEPDINRNKELLEQFTIESLEMVGTIEKNAQVWALIDDNKGNIHYVKEGNHLGQDHGKIVIVREDHIQIMEIISNGVNGWVERPRTIELMQ